MWTDTYVSSDGAAVPRWTVALRVKRAKKGETHRHKMGGARFDMSAPDIRDKPEESSNIQPGVWDCGAQSQTKLLIEWMVSGCEI